MRSRARDDVGAVTALTAGLIGSFVLLSVLVPGGSLVLRARSDAFGQAAAAARAGTQELDQDALAQGDVLLDDDAATDAAQRYLDTVGATGSATTSGSDVIVTVTDSVEMPMLGNVIPVEATATVSAMKGTNP